MTGLELAGLAGGSLAVGLALGATGIGGFLMVPLFAALAGLPVPAAVGTALVLGILTALPNLWLYARHVGIDAGLAWPLAVGAGIAAPLGAWAAPLLPAAAVTLALAVTILAGCLPMLRPPAVVDAGAGARAAGPAAGTPPGGRSTAANLAVGAASGLLGAVTGAGGPLVSVPMLVALGRPLQKAIGASLCMLLAIGLGAGGSYLARGLVDGTALAWTTPPQALGIWIGLRWALALHPARLKRLVAGVCCLVALGLLVQGVTGLVRAG